MYHFKSISPPSNITVPLSCQSGSLHSSLLSHNLFSLSFIYVKQIKVRLSLWIAVMDFDSGMGFPFGFRFCGFCVDFALIFFFFFLGFVHGGGGGRVFLWWWGGLLPWVWVGCCRVCRYEVVGVYRDGWGGCREVGCCGQYIHHRVYIHTLLLIYATYWYCFSLMCLLVLHTHICMHACSHFCSPEHGAHTRTQ